MVTNALQEIIKPIGYIKRADGFLGFYSYNFRGDSPYINYYLSSLGGILMFDERLPEDVNQLYPPNSATTIACASYYVTNDTTNPVMGDYNITESAYTPSERKMKFIYDFKTSQGNGTISSVALTHRLGAFTPWTSSNVNVQKSALFLDSYINTSYYIGANSESISLGNSQCLFQSNLNYYLNGYSTHMNSKPEILFLIDPESDVIWTMQIMSATEITIRKRQAHFYSFSIFSSPISTHEIIESKSVTLNTQLDLSSRNYYHSIYYDTEKNALYILNTGNKEIPNSGSFTITEITIPSCSLQQYSFTNNTGIAIRGKMFLIKNNTLYITGRKSYSSNGTYYSTYLYQCNNITSSQELEVLFSDLDRKDRTECELYPILCLGNNVILMYWRYQQNGRDYRTEVGVLKSDGSVKLTGQFIYMGERDWHNRFVPVVNNPLLFYRLDNGGQTYSGYCMCNNYLATINNLATPVIKTADRTMKVTYTIQETDYV